MCLTSSCALKYAWRELQVDGEKILSKLNNRKKQNKTKLEWSKKKKQKLVPWCSKGFLLLCCCFCWDNIGLSWPDLWVSMGSCLHFPGSLVAQMVKNLPTMREIQVRSLGQEDPLETRMATHSNILAWEIPWTEEPGGLQSMGSQRVKHNWSD